ncbi:hypothetical protein [Kitasatospora aureofaciens]|uniref:hypothetical protein n=1 Tax=Kitasatospora aureofaciens TaxID=1894 RepID=UPI0037F877ED
MKDRGRKSWTWDQIDHLWVQKSNAKGTIIEKVVVVDTRGKSTRLAAPYSNSSSMMSMTFDEDAARAIAYWQRRTGRPLTPPIVDKRRSTMFGRWKKV